MQRAARVNSGKDTIHQPVGVGSGVQRGVPGGATAPGIQAGASSEGVF